MSDPVNLPSKDQALAALEPVAVSPNGVPLLPPKLASILAMIVAILAPLQFVPGMPAIVVLVSQIVVAVGAVLGLASPGVRK